MSGAQDVIWAVADDAEVVPGSLADLPALARVLVDAWLGQTFTACPHDAVHFAVMPAPLALCFACTRYAGTLQLATRCAGCREPLDDDALVAAYALGDDCIAFITMCAACAYEGGSP